jgi:hypothetical protein
VIADLETLKTRLADSAARSDIECYSDRNEGWHNLRSVDRDQVECVRIAVHYLTMRGLLEIHPERPELVRIRAEDAVPGVDDLCPEIHA